MSDKFCRCGKPVYKGGRCNACYMVDYRAAQKEKSEIAPQVINPFTWEEQLRAELLPIFKEQTDQLITDWTEQNIFLPDGEGFFSASHPDWSLAPEMEFVFEQLKNPDVKEIYLMFGSQSSKTLFQICAMSYFVGVKKVNGLFVPPDERLINRLKIRMEAIWEKSPALGFEAKKGGKEASKFGSNRIVWGLASSPSSLAEMPADFVDFDEIDEIKPQELNPVNLARSRGRTKPNFKLILASTPKLLEGKGGIQDYYNDSKRFVIEMQCPHCEEWSEFDETTIQAEENADHRRIEAESLGFAVCPNHGCVIEDEHHEKMVLNQRWKDLDPDLPMTYVGFHKASWNTIHNDFSSIAAKRIKTKEEGPNSYKDFFNSECARPVDLEALGSDLDKSDLTLDTYNRKEIPGDVKCITIGVDLGVKCASVVVLGWANQCKLYQIYEQEISWDDREFDKIERGLGYLIEEVNHEFHWLGDGQRPKFVGGAFDAGYRSNLVYDYCRRNPLWIPVMGKEPLNQPWIITSADPKKKYGAQSRGVKLYTLKSYYWQDVLQTAIERPRDTLGSFNIPIDVYDRYVKHLQGEVKKLVQNAKGLQVEIWEKKNRHAKVDFRDATIYALVRGYTLELDKLRDVQRTVKESTPKGLNKFNAGNNRRGIGKARRR